MQAGDPRLALALSHNAQRTETIIAIDARKRSGHWRSVDPTGIVCAPHKILAAPLTTIRQFNNTFSRGR
jgi:hypothetical protein